MAFIFVLIAAFLSFMISVLLVSAMPGLTIKLLELFGLYPHGTLSSETNDFITGAGYYRRGKVYMFRNDEGTERFDNGRVFGYLLLIFELSSFILSLIAYFLFRVFVK